MILFALTKFFFYFALASSLSDSGNSSLMKSSISFSSRMSITLYFHARKLSTPSSFSSSLVLGAFLSLNSNTIRKMKIVQRKVLNLPESVLCQGKDVPSLGELLDGFVLTKVLQKVGEFTF
jgi:hypothetical protein